MSDKWSWGGLASKLKNTIKDYASTPNSPEPAPLQKNEEKKQEEEIKEEITISSPRIEEKKEDPPKLESSKHDSKIESSKQDSKPESSSSLFSGLSTPFFARKPDIKDPSKPEIHLHTELQKVSITQIVHDGPLLRQQVQEFEIGIEKTGNKVQKLARLAKLIQGTTLQLQQYQNEFSRELKEFSTLGFDNQIASVFSQFAKSLKEVEEIEGVMAEQMNNLVAAPLEAFTKEILEETKERKKKFNRELQLYETTVQRVVTSRKKNLPPQRITDLDNELFSSRKTYHKSCFEYVSALNSILSSQSLAILQHISSYMYAYTTYFNHGSNILKDRDTLMDTATHMVQDRKKDLVQMSIQKPNPEVLEQLISSAMAVETEDPAQQTTRRGYVWMKTTGMIHDLKRRYLVVEDHHFKIYKINEYLPMVCSPTLLCSAKETFDNDKMFAFEIATPDESYSFIAETQHDMKAWITVLHNSTFAALNSQSIPEKSKGSSNTPRQNPLTTLRTFSPDNNICADCGSPSPEWASINLGLLICIKCSGIHRNMGVHISKVRSFTLDKWDELSINAMIAVGNKNGASIFEATCPDLEFRRKNLSTTLERETWIKEKYVEKLFIPKPTCSPEDLSIFLFQAAKENKPVDLLRLLIQGANVDFQNSLDINRSSLHIAILQGNLVIAYYLLNNKAKVDLIDELGQTALHYAAFNNDTDSAALLMKYGAKLDIKDVKGRTAIDLAAEFQKADCLTLLRLQVMALESGNDEFTEAIESFTRATTKRPETKSTNTTTNTTTSIQPPIQDLQTTAPPNTPASNNNNLIDFADF